MYKQVIKSINEAGEKLGAVTTFTMASATCSVLDILRDNSYFAGSFGMLTLGSFMYGMTEIDRIKIAIAKLPAGEAVSKLCTKMLREGWSAGAHGISTGLGLGIGGFEIVEGRGFSGGVFLAFAALSAGGYFKRKADSEMTNSTLDILLLHRIQDSRRD